MSQLPSHAPQCRSVAQTAAARNVIVVLMLSIAPVWAVAGETLDRVKQSQTLKIGYGTESLFVSKDGSGNPSGYAIDLCKKLVEGVQKELGASALKAEFVAVPKAEGVQAVAQGKIDILCEADVPTAEKRKAVSYTIPIFATGIAAVVNRSSSQRLKDILSARATTPAPLWRGNADQLLRQSKIAVISGTRADAIVKEKLTELEMVPQVVTVPDYLTGLQRVLDGRSNVFFGERAVLVDAVRHGAFPRDLEVLDRYFSQETLAFAVPRNDEDFRLAVDVALSKFFRSDDFPLFYKGWFGPLNQSGLTLFRLNALPN